MDYQAIDLTRVFQAHVLRAGSHLSEGGRVSLFDVRPTEGRAFGIVKEAVGQSIRVSARISRTNSGEPVLSGACTRSGDKDCEHLAALLWQAMDPEARERGKELLATQGAMDLRAPAGQTSDHSNEVLVDDRRAPGLSSRREAPGSRDGGVVHRGSAARARGFGESTGRDLSPGGPARGDRSPGGSTGGALTPGRSASGALSPGEADGRGSTRGGGNFAPFPGRQRVPRIEEDWQVRRWTEALRRELPSGGSQLSPRGQQYRLLYFLEPAVGSSGRSASSVAILPVLVTLLRHGGDGREKRFDWYSLDRDPRPKFVTEADETVLTLIEAARRFRSYGLSSYSAVELHPDRAVSALERAVATGRCHWQQRQGPRLLPGRPRSGLLTWKVDAQGHQRAAVELDGESVQILPITPPWYVDTSSGECGPIETGVPARVASAFLNAPPLPPESAAVARKQLEDIASEHRIPAPLVLQVVEEKTPAAPVPRLFLHGVSLRIPFGSAKPVDTPEIILPAARLSFSYGDHTVAAYDPQPGFSVLNGDVIRRIRRDRAMEAAAIRRLEACGLESYGGAPGPPGTGLLPNDFESDDDDPLDSMLDFVIRALPKLQEDGWLVETSPSFPCRLVSGDSEWYADLDQEPGQDWFDLEMGVTIDGNKVNLLPLLVRLIHDEPEELSTDPAAGAPAPVGVLIPLEDGRLLPVPAERVQRILRFLRELYDGDGLEADNRLRLSVLQAPALAQVEDDAAGSAISLSGGEQLRELGRRLRDFRGIESIEPPRGLHGVLRHYQSEGVSWLQFLRSHGLGGLLADDMGLGKTIQGLAHLLIEKENARSDRPSLVVAPTSLMVNWEREAAQFAPDLRVLRLQGPDRRARLDSVGDADVVLTTYPLLWRDREALLAREYHILILDEAQFLKNHRTKGARVAREIRARHRLGFTGTPFENRLMELWSLFDILMPGVLGDEKRFRKVFVGPIEKRGDGEQRRRLAARVHPFLLRRTKDKVATELPPKTEIVQAVELAEAQRDLYETIRLAMHERVRREVAKKGLDRSRIIILDALLKLRQVCCDPRLLKTAHAREVRESAKLEALLGMLEEMTAEGRRILLFSQFTSMLALIEPELVSRKISFVRLTGETRDRAKPVAAFQAGEASVFVISLKAGGTGLNLTAADTVVLYDPWWNPAVEDQAMDRAHRIGQSKKVFVYKLIAAGSVEEKILAMQQRKRDLVKSVLAPGEDAGVLLTEQDLEVLFEPIG